MIYYCVVNESDRFDLTKWDNYEFRDTLTLVLQTIDLQLVKEVFSNIRKIEIYNDNNLLAIYNSFDSFSSINYLGTVYVEHEHKFTDALSVTLIKTDIVEQVKRIDEQLNPVINIESMTLDEYKQYQLKELSKQCTASIYQGDLVQLSDGSTEYFSFDDKDQTDLQSLSSIAMMDPTVELTWHSNGKLCRFYSGIDIILIYQTLNMKLFRETTICNAINLLIRNATSKEEVSNYYWGCELPPESQNRVNELINKMNLIVGEIIRKFIPEDVIPQSQEEPDEPIETNDDDINEEQVDNN